MMKTHFPSYQGCYLSQVRVTRFFFWSFAETHMHTCNILNSIINVSFGVDLNVLIWDWCNTEYLSIHLIWENRWHIKMCYKKCICSLSSHKSSTSGLGLTYWWFTSEQFATWIWWILFSTESLHQKQINQQFITIGYFGMYYFLSLDGIQITWVVCYNSLMNHKLMTITFIIVPFEYKNLQQNHVT